MSVADSHMPTAIETPPRCKLPLLGRIGLFFIPVTLITVAWGTPTNFFPQIQTALCPEPSPSVSQFHDGAKLYVQHCANCHGERGDGNGITSLTTNARYFGHEPYKFAMTTGPAMVIADGKFNGQRTSYWTNAGEETVLRVDKALSVRTRSTETEDAKEGNRDLVWIGARQYRKTVVEGEVTVNNHRKETVQLVIRRRFSGELISAEGEPKSALREEGVYSVNKRNELLWTIPLKAGEERKLKYRYSVLVSH